MRGQRPRNDRPKNRFRPLVGDLEPRVVLSSIGLSSRPGLAAIQEWRAQAAARIQARTAHGGADRWAGWAARHGVGNSGVFTYHNDTYRSGWYSNETTLTPQNVNPTSFGKQWGYFVDGHMNAQPLHIARVPIQGRLHNIVIAATENDSVYAFDADNPRGGPQHNGVLWKTSFVDPNRGVTAVPAQDLNEATLTPTVGITRRRHDPNSGTLYVIAETLEAVPNT